MPTCPAPNRSAHQPTFHGCLCSWDELLALGAPPPCDAPPAGIQDWCHAYRPSRLFAYGMALEATGGDSDAILAELGAAYNALSACEVRPPITPHSSHPNTFLPSHHIHKRLYTLRHPRLDVRLTYRWTRSDVRAIRRVLRSSSYRHVQRRGVATSMAR